MSLLAQNYEAGKRVKGHEEGPAQVFPHPEADPNTQPAEGQVLMRQPDTQNMFTHYPSQATHPPTHPPTHKGFWVASIILTAVAGLFSIGSIVIAALVLNYCATTESKEEGGAIGRGISGLLYGLMMAESCLCFVAMVACFALMLAKPYKVLIRSPRNGSFGCLCASVFLLFLFGVYAIVIQAFWGGEYEDYLGMHRGLCVIHSVRAAALLCFFAVLVANSKARPHD